MHNNACTSLFFFFHQQFSNLKERYTRVLISFSQQQGEKCECAVKNKIKKLSRKFIDSKDRYEAKVARHVHTPQFYLQF